VRQRATDDIASDIRNEAKMRSNLKSQIKYEPSVKKEMKTNEPDRPQRGGVHPMARNDRRNM
jgi:hypothetical protein